MTLETEIPTLIEHKIHRIYHHHHYHHLHQTLEHHHLHIHNQSIYRHKSRHGNDVVECLAPQQNEQQQQQQISPALIGIDRHNQKAIQDKPTTTTNTMSKQLRYEQPLDQKELQLQQYIDQSCGNSLASNSSCSGSDSDSSCSGDGYQLLQANGLTHLIARHNQREQRLKQQEYGRLHNHHHQQQQSTSALSSSTTTLTTAIAVTAANTTTTTTDTTSSSSSSSSSASASISSKQKSQIQFILMAALTYILSPIDLIPEAIFGIFGLLDDIVFLLMCLVCVVVILIYPVFRELRRTMLGKLGFKQQQFEITMNNNKDTPSS